MIKRSWWLILATILLSLAAGLYISHQQPEIFEARSSLLITPRDENMSETQLLNNVSNLARQSAIPTTYCGIIESNATFNHALALLNVPVSGATAYSVDCQVRADSSVIQIVANGPSKALATDLVATIGDVAKQGPTEIQEVLKLEVIDPATASASPIAPNHSLNLMMSGLIGLVGGLLLAFLRNLLAPHREAIMERPIATREERTNVRTAPAATSDQLYPVIVDDRQ